MTALEDSVAPYASAGASNQEIRRGSDDRA
jgi:hypothetical protein